MIVAYQDTKTQIIKYAPSKTHIILVNKNIAPSKLPREVDERMPSGASPRFDFLVSLYYLVGAMGIPKLRLLPLLVP